MARKARFASRHGGSAPPWHARKLDLVVPLSVALSLRRAAQEFPASGETGYSIRRHGTIMVWREGTVIGSLTLVLTARRGGRARLKRIEWDGARGHSEADIWRAIETLARGPLGLRVEPTAAPGNAN